MFLVIGEKPSVLRRSQAGRLRDRVPSHPFYGRGAPLLTAAMYCIILYLLK